LRSESTLGGGIDDKNDLALEVGERESLALFVDGLEVVEGSSGSHVDV
jgi:hypothetical protein